MIAIVSCTRSVKAAHDVLEKIVYERDRHGRVVWLFLSLL